MTFHGMIDGVLIEGNTIEQDASAPGCWLMSITQGYATAEWFRNFVVRNNRLINGGNNAMNAQSAPGIVVEGNVIINTQPDLPGRPSAWATPTTRTVTCRTATPWCATTRCAKAAENLPRLLGEGAAVKHGGRQRGDHRCRGGRRRLRALRPRSHAPVGVLNGSG